MSFFGRNRRHADTPPGESMRVLPSVSSVNSNERSTLDIPAGTQREEIVTSRPRPLGEKPIDKIVHKPSLGNKLFKSNKNCFQVMVEDYTPFAELDVNTTGVKLVQELYSQLKNKRTQESLLILQNQDLRAAKGVVEDFTEKLQGEKDRADKKIKKLEQLGLDQFGKERALKKEKEKLASALQLQLDIFDAKVAGLSKKLEGHASQDLVYQGEIGDLNSRLEEKQRTFEDFKKQTSEEKERLEENLEKERKLFQTQLTENEKRVAGLKEHITTSAQISVWLNADLDKQEIAFESFKKESLEEKEKLLDVIASTKAQVEDEEVIRTKQKNEYEERIAELKEEMVKEKKKLIEFWKSEKAAYVDEIHELKQQGQKDNEEIIRLKNLNETYVTREGQHKHKIDCLEWEISQLKKKCEEDALDRESLRDEIDSKSDLIFDLQTVMNSIQKQLTGVLHAQQESAESIVKLTSELDKTNTDFQSMNKFYTDELTSRNQVIQDLEVTNNKLRKEVTDLHAEYSEFSSFVTV